MFRCGGLVQTYDVSIGTIHKVLVLHEKLGLRKISTGWVDLPHVLTPEKKRISDVVTGDETWIYFYGIPNKHSNMMWLTTDESRPVLCKPGAVFTNHSLERSLSYSPEFSMYRSI